MTVIIDDINDSCCMLNLQHSSKLQLAIVLSCNEKIRGHRVKVKGKKFKNKSKSNLYTLKKLTREFFVTGHRIEKLSKLREI